MPTDLYAYRASVELADAVRDRTGARIAYCREALEAFRSWYGGPKVIYQRNPFRLDARAVGFADDDPDSDPPTIGLTRRRRNARYLTPTRDIHGGPYRAHLAHVNAAPSLDGAFADHGISTFVDTVSGRAHLIGYHFTDGLRLVACRIELPPSPHLTPIRLSEYYREIEAVGRAAAGPTVTRSIDGRLITPSDTLAAVCINSSCDVFLFGPSYTAHCPGCRQPGKPAHRWGFEIAGEEH
jgi:hypothetical protein